MESQLKINEKPVLIISNSVIHKLNLKVIFKISNRLKTCPFWKDMIAVWIILLVWVKGALSCLTVFLTKECKTFVFMVNVVFVAIKFCLYVSFW